MLKPVAYFLPGMFSHLLIRLLEASTQHGWITYALFTFYALAGAFQIWMCVHAFIRGEYFWAMALWFMPVIMAIIYYFTMYRSADLTRGFELPGANRRKRIKELQSQIHHLDNAIHYFQLGDIYFQQGKMALAENAYRASLERDPKDIDARAHLGQCLLRQKKAAEARPLLEGVCAENPKHDYGYSMMALAECLTALGEPQTALRIWQQVTANNSYPRAKVQLAELYLANQQPDLARAELKDVLADDAHAPKFQRRRDRVWVRRARALSRGKL